MKVFRSHDSPFRAADAQSFVGPAETRLLASSEEATPVHVYHVKFEPGARTNWHTHSGPQWLLITEGRIRVQRWGEAAQDVDAGDAVVFAPGEKHWHGSSAGSRGVHLAINVNLKTEWLEPVSDEQYSEHDGIPFASRAAEGRMNRNAADDTPNDREGMDPGPDTVDPAPLLGQVGEGATLPSGEVIARETRELMNSDADGDDDQMISADPEMPPIVPDRK